MYSLESHLVNDFTDYIQNPRNLFSISNFAFEFDYRNGRVDVICQSGKGYLLSFEAKLYDWKKALNQAYRNTCFSHYSYVLLPKKMVPKVKNYYQEFRRRNVGLCSMNNQKAYIEIPASKRKPIQPWLTESAINHILNG